MSAVVCVPLSNQLQVPFLNLRSIYEIRERPSRMYSWTALLTSQMLVEIPWNILGSSLFFFCWYWTVGFPTDRGGYTYLLYGILTPVYYTTLGQVRHIKLDFSLFRMTDELHRPLPRCLPTWRSQCSSSHSSLRLL